MPELVKHIAEAGFLVKRALGVCPMPRAMRTGRFGSRELLEHVELSDDAENAYGFYVESTKPPSARA